MLEEKEEPTGDNTEKVEEEKVEETVEEEVEEEESPETTPDEEPPTRKSAKDFIIERQRKKIEKLRSEEEEEDDKGDDKGDVRSIIQQELEPIKKSFVTSSDERELRESLKNYPEAKGMEKTIRRYMESPAYQSVSVDFIVRGLLGNKAEKKLSADIENKQTKTGGATKRPKEPTKLPDFSSMSDAEFAQYNRENR